MALSKRAQDTTNAFCMESLSLYDQASSIIRKAVPSGEEVAEILEGFTLTLAENVSSDYHSYLFGDYGDFSDCAA